MKKVIAWIAILLVAFIPTYIIIFGGIKTAVPDVILGDSVLYPSTVRWVTVEDEQVVSETSPLQPVMNFLFSHSDPTVLTSVNSIGALKMELEPSFAMVYIYDLTSESSEAAMIVSYADILEGKVDKLDYPAQVDLALKWVITDSIHIQTVYTFEVMA